MNFTPVTNTVKPKQSTYTNSCLLNITMLLMAQDTLSRDYILGNTSTIDKKNRMDSIASEVVGTNVYMWNHLESLRYCSTGESPCLGPKEPLSIKRTLLQAALT